MTDAYRLIAAEKANFPVSLMSRVLGVNRTAYHRWEGRAPSQRARLGSNLFGPQQQKEISANGSMAEVSTNWSRNLAALIGTLTDLMLVSSTVAIH